MMVRGGRGKYVEYQIITILSSYGSIDGYVIMTTMKGLVCGNIGM